jgi:hypothetical protein
VQSIYPSRKGAHDIFEFDFTAPLFDSKGVASQSERINEIAHKAEEYTKYYLKLGDVVQHT